MRLQDDAGREGAVTSAGIRLENALYERDGFSAYERTDDAPVLTRTAWYRSSLSFDIEDIEDSIRVVDALASHLPSAYFSLTGQSCAGPRYPHACKRSPSPSIQRSPMSSR